MFYPDDAAALASCVSEYLAQAPGPPDSRPPKALIVPHAGYVYSGPVAASAYRMLAAVRSHIRRVVLLGPAHRVYFQGMAVPSVDAFSMPNGEVELDRESIGQALALPGVVTSDSAHAMEHSLEVHLPFLQAVLDHFTLVPIVVGECPSADVGRVLELLWGGEETLIVVSSDLSHYHSYADAQKRDAATTREIVARSVTLTGDQACGAYAINGLMCVAAARDMQVQVLEVCNSGDTAGDRNQVVGYGAYALH
jgi:AmmeMemoRadiSam system protein B